MFRRLEVEVGLLLRLVDEEAMVEVSCGYLPSTISICRRAPEYLLTASLCMAGAVVAAEAACSWVASFLSAGEMSRRMEEWRVETRHVLSTSIILAELAAAVESPSVPTVTIIKELWKPWLADSAIPPTTTEWVSRTWVIFVDNVLQWHWCTVVMMLASSLISWTLWKV
jgi:hypothetical protein